VEIGPIYEDFEVTGDHEFAVGQLLLGSSMVDVGTDPMKQRGDPSLTFATAVEQYRTKYVFLAPDDYDESFVVATMPVNAHVVIDGATANEALADIGSSGFTVMRVRLGAGVAGAHTLTSDVPVGIQVMGYGAFTSYEYPGGLNLVNIAPPPPPIL
jgi:hypothetical protein